MSKFFFALSISLFMIVLVFLLFDVNKLACSEPYIFTPSDAIGVLSFLVVFWGTGVLTGAAFQMDKEN
jgi:hypothetical protein